MARTGWPCTQRRVVGHVLCVAGLDAQQWRALNVIVLLICGFHGLACACACQAMTCMCMCMRRAIQWPPPTAWSLEHDQVACEDPVRFTMPYPWGQSQPQRGTEFLIWTYICIPCWSTNFSSADIRHTYVLHDSVHEAQMYGLFTVGKPEPTSTDLV